MTEGQITESVTIRGRVNMTEGQITGLRPFTQYVVFVSSENGVSAQDTDASGRTVNTSITTLEGGEFCSLTCVERFQEIVLRTVHRQRLWVVSERSKCCCAIIQPFSCFFCRTC